MQHCKLVLTGQRQCLFAFIFWSNLLAQSHSHEAQAAGVALTRWGIVHIKLLDSKYPEAGETQQFFFWHELLKYVITWKIENESNTSWMSCKYSTSLSQHIQQEPCPTALTIIANGLQENKNSL